MEKLENLTREEIENRIFEFEQELKKLIEEEKELTSKPIAELRKDKSNFSKLTANTQRRFNLRRLIRVYRNKLVEDIYQGVTEEFTKELDNQTYKGEFSWGLDEKHESKRDVLLKQGKGSGGERIEVVNCGRFKYVTGKNGVRIEDMPDDEKVIDTLSANIMQDGTLQITTGEIRDLLQRHPQMTRERLSLLLITKTIGNNPPKDYFILSPVTKQQLEIPELKKFFVETYCSTRYLESVVNGQNGIYAGAIKPKADGSYTIKFSKDSLEAAKRAETTQGSTSMLVEGTSTPILGTEENLRKMLERFKEVRKGPNGLSEDKDKGVELE